MTPTEPVGAAADRFTVRRAEIDDLQPLVDFAIAEAREAEGVAKTKENVLVGVRRGLEDESIARYWVVLDDRGPIVGNISVVREWSNWNAGFYWWVQSMFIVPEHRGKGLMQLLIDTVAEVARNEDAVDIRLCVHRDNARAIRAYRKVGFRDSSYRVMALEV